jgi:bifunctional DNA-binding transcriptional regulator/antitoxin component of YhaV-PrlF toxin-antitoxin module
MKQLTRIVRPLRSGQITIPREFRRALNLDKYDMLQVTLDGDELRIRPVTLAEVETGSDWLYDLYLLFAPARQQAAAHTEEQVNADIDAVLADIRERAHASSRA